METDVRKLSECPDCASRNIVKSLLREQLICRECGLIFEPFAATSEQVSLIKTKKARATKKPKKRRK